MKSDAHEMPDGFGVFHKEIRGEASGERSQDRESLSESSPDPPEGPRGFEAEKIEIAPVAGPCWPSSSGGPFRRF